MIKTGSDFSGVGAFDQALNRLGIKQDKLFACDMDKYARQTYIHNFGEPKYYPTNVYEREVPKESLDIYMTSPPCQSFSLAGKRKGEDSENGILFYNSHEFIVKNNPRYFIFENVKGLLSDNGGKTFQTWLDMLGGKSVNGNPVIFPREDAVHYHIYHKVLNAKNYGIPQNRERVFIVGIRDDADNVFKWEKPIPLQKKLKDVLEDEVDDKYFLSDKLINTFLNRPQAKNYPFKPLTEDSRHTQCLTARYYKLGATDPYIKTNEIIQLNNPKHSNDRIYSEEGLSPTLNTMQGGNRQPFVKINSATKKGYEVATENDSINLTFPDSKTRRGRVGVGVSQTLDTACNQGVFNNKKIRRLTPKECFRLMDFNENFKWNVSDTQAYKQAGNSIAVGVLVGIIKNLKLK